ncbi:uncharacterized protein [Argopecten irradians]|uniref:uncharacterized protein n=1 Tax=Argopecten irradians TaxID=31199 RepID=UPI003710D39A
MVNGEEDGPKVRAQERFNNRFIYCCPKQIFDVYSTQKRTMGEKAKKRKKDQTEVERGGVVTVDLDTSYPKGKLPPAPFTLTNEEKMIADSRLSMLKFPPNFGDIPDTLFTRICGGTKTHTWHQVSVIDESGYIGG